MTSMEENLCIRHWALSNCRYKKLKVLYNEHVSTDNRKQPKKTFMDKTIKEDADLD